MKSPNIYQLRQLSGMYHDTNYPRAKIGSAWYPARPKGLPSLKWRLRATWLVFTGQADAVIWPGGQ